MTPKKLPRCQQTLRTFKNCLSPEPFTLESLQQEEFAQPSLVSSVQTGQFLVSDLARVDEGSESSKPLDSGMQQSVLTGSFLIGDLVRLENSSSQADSTVSEDSESDYADDLDQFVNEVSFLDDEVTAEAIQQPEIHLTGQFLAADLAQLDQQIFEQQSAERLESVESTSSDELFDHSSLLSELDAELAEPIDAASTDDIPVQEIPAEIFESVHTGMFLIKDLDQFALLTEQTEATELAAEEPSSAEVFETDSLATELLAEQEIASIVTEEESDDLVAEPADTATSDELVEALTAEDHQLIHVAVSLNQSLDEVERAAVSVAELEDFSAEISGELIDSENLLAVTFEETTEPEVEPEPLVDEEEERSTEIEEIDADLLAAACENDTAEAEQPLLDTTVEVASTPDVEPTLEAVVEATLESPAETIKEAEDGSLQAFQTGQFFAIDLAQLEARLAELEQNTVQPSETPAAAEIASAPESADLAVAVLESVEAAAVVESEIDIDVEFEDEPEAVEPVVVESAIAESVVAESVVTESVVGSDCLAAEVWQLVEAELQQDAIAHQGIVELSFGELVAFQKNDRINVLFDAADEELVDPSKRRRHTVEVTKAEQRTVDNQSLNQAFTQFKKESVEVAKKQQADREKGIDFYYTEVTQNRASSFRR
jgi:hypothetical protein